MNLYAKWNNMCVYSQCSCHLVYSNPLWKTQTWLSKIGFSGDFTQPFGVPFTVLSRSIANIMTSMSQMQFLSGCKSGFDFPMAATRHDWFVDWWLPVPQQSADSIKHWCIIHSIPFSALHVWIDFQIDAGRVMKVLKLDKNKYTAACSWSVCAIILL